MKMYFHGPRPSVEPVPTAVVVYKSFRKVSVDP
jgi:hypothetical protein